MTPGRPLAGRICLVAGASRGVGRGVAKALGDAGATVIVTGRSSEAGPHTDQRPETFEDAVGDVLIIGFGRFGQLVSQMFLAGGYRPIILDNDAERVTEARRFGSRVFYGEGHRLDVLRSVGAERCQLIAVCTSPAERTNAIVEVIHAQFPEVKVFARAFDRRHALNLLDLGIAYQRRETLDSAIRFGRDALVALGMEATVAGETEERVRKLDSDRLDFQRIEGLVEGHRKWKEVTPEPFTRLAPGDDGDAPPKAPPKQEAAE